MTAYGEAQDAADKTWQHDRVVALLVPCVDDCQQPAGELCRNLRTGQPLEHQAAHAKRIERGRELWGVGENRKEANDHEHVR